MKPSRRDFLLKGTATVVGISYALGASAAPAQEAPANATPLELGLASYTFREFNRADCIAMAKRLKLKKMCFKSMHLEMNATDEECRQAAEECRKAGMDLYGCGVCYMNTAAEVVNTFRYAKAAGMRVIVGVPKHDLLPLVEQKVKETGILMAIHNHGPGDLLYPTSTSVMEKVAQLDKRIGVCLDVGHVVRLGLDPVEAVLECGERLHDIHLKDQSAATAQSQTLVCGQGIIDFPAIIRALKQIHYSGVISFEYEAEGKDPLAGLAESVGFIRGVMKTVA